MRIDVQAGKKKATVHSPEAGERLKYFRLQKGLSQQELAEGICSSSAISLFEGGTKGISVHLLAKLADKLQVALQEIYRPKNRGDFPIGVKLEIIEAYLKRNELEPAREMIEHVKSSDSIRMFEKQQLDYLQSEYLIRSGKASKAIRYLQPLVDSFETMESMDSLMMCKCLNALGTAYFQSHDFTKAYAAYKRGYQISLRLPVFDTVSASVTYNLGLVCNELSLKSDASIYLEMAMQYYTSIDDFRKMADAFFALSIATGCEDHLKKALTLYEGLEVYKMVQIAKQHDAFYNESARDYAASITKLKDIATEFVKMGETERCVFTLSRGAVLGINKTDLPTAQEFLLLAAQHKEGLADSGQFIPYFYLAQAKYYFATKRFDKCLHNAYRALELYDKMGMYSHKAEAMEIAVLALRDSGEVQQALDLSLEVNETLRQIRRN